MDRGWIPKGSLHDSKLKQACIREDDGDYKCVLKRGQLDKNVIVALVFVFDADNIDNPSSQSMLKLTGADLETAARPVISDYFDQHRHEGITCDFGGIALLVESTRAITDDDSIGLDDDSYLIVRRGPAVSF